ncbi:MAG: hypothetical protein LN408_04645 [Candidatus Thermoplasmatota archaeon]|nr:hypothetical protein [Candidatus Thermoplasmatota archaeon]
MSIGLDFVKEIDKHWEKHVQSLDRVKENETKIEKIDLTNKFKDYKKPENKDDENLDWNYWAYWKKRYSIMR